MELHNATHASPIKLETDQQFSQNWFYTTQVCELLYTRGVSFLKHCWDFLINIFVILNYVYTVLQLVSIFYTKKRFLNVVKIYHSHNNIKFVLTLFKNLNIHTITFKISKVIKAGTRWMTSKWPNKGETCSKLHRTL